MLCDAILRKDATFTKVLWQVQQCWGCDFWPTLSHFSQQPSEVSRTDLLILILPVEKMGWKAWVAHPGSQGLIVVGQDWNPALRTADLLLLSLADAVLIIYIIGWQMQEMNMSVLMGVLENQGVGLEWDASVAGADLANDEWLESHSVANSLNPYCHSKDIRFYSR